LKRKVKHLEPNEVQSFKLETNPSTIPSLQAADSTYSVPDVVAAAADAAGSGSGPEIMRFSN